MQYANVNGERREASPNAKGECPLCGSEVISKCGNIKVHHWAHVSGSDECESGKESESKEHRVFKEQFPEWCREVVHGSRRADVLVGRFVVEYQKSNISFEDMLERTKDWNTLGYKVFWILDYEKIASNFERKNYETVSYRWKWMRQIIKKVFNENLNVSFYIKGLEDDKLFKIEKFYTEALRGKLLDEKRFVKVLKEKALNGLQKHTA